MKIHWSTANPLIINWQTNSHHIWPMSDCDMWVSKLCGLCSYFWSIRWTSSIPKRSHNKVVSSCCVITVLLLVDLPPECQTIAPSSWDKRDLLTLWEEWSQSVDGSMPWPLSLNITHCVCRRIRPPNCGTASLRLHCVANERSFPPWVTRGVFASDLARNVSLCFHPLGLISRKER